MGEARRPEARWVRIGNRLVTAQVLREDPDTGFVTLLVREDRILEDKTPRKTLRPMKKDKEIPRKRAKLREGPPRADAVERRGGQDAVMVELEETGGASGPCRRRIRKCPPERGTPAYVYTRFSGTGRARPDAANGSLMRAVNQAMVPISYANGAAHDADVLKLSFVAANCYSSSQYCGGGSMAVRAGRKKRVDMDIIIGRNLRSLREEAGISQMGLAEQLDMSYRQVQKYEQGLDRIASSTLFSVSNKLRVPITAFFEGLETDTGD